jgi:hypothetical protein
MSMCAICGGQGWYADGHPDDPQQVQCESCHGKGVIMEITFDDAVKIIEAGRMIAESGNGPDLSDVCERITEQWPQLKKDMGGT